MASVIIIPIIITVVVGLTAYLMYKYVMFDYICKRSVNQTLQKYNIQKTPSKIIKEYYEDKGEQKSHKEIQRLEKYYRQKEPDQFLAMYDAIREKR